MTPLRLTARWVVPVCAPPLARGAVLIGADGRIAAVGPDDEVARPAGVAVRDLGDAVLLPGLVNTHTHLELTALRGLVDERPFARWVGRIRRIKERLGDDDYRASARWGVLEGFAAGITTTGDTGSSGAPARAMADLGARGVAFHEVFGPDPATCPASLAGLDAALESLAACVSPRLTIGVSPHAPYTVSARLLDAVARLARDRGLPLAMHLAESPEETAFVVRGEGAFAEHLRGRGIAVEPRGVSPVAWALGYLGDVRPLLIHCVQVDGEDRAAVARCGASVAHCPWSNDVLGVGRADLGELLRLGIPTGLGTDSVAAGRDLDLFDEARHAAAGAPLPSARLLDLVTREGARALGIADAGFLAPGAWADLCAVSLDGLPAGPASDPVEAVVRHASASAVRTTWVAGRVVYDAGVWPGVDAAAERTALGRTEATAREAAAAR